MTAAGEKESGASRMFGVACFAVGLFVWIKAIPILWGWFAVPLGLKVDAPITTLVGFAMTLDLLSGPHDVSEPQPLGLRGLVFFFRVMFAVLFGYVLHSCT